MKKGLSFLTATILLVASSFAYGEAYIGASVGQFDVGDSEFDKGTSFGVFTGYKFNEYFAIEGGYNDLGDAKDDVAPIWTVSASALNLSAIAMYPVTEKLDIYARAGAYYWDASLSEAGFGKFDGNDGTDLGYGAGANLNFTDSVGIFVEYLRLNVDGDDAFNISAGLKFSFGGNQKTTSTTSSRDNMYITSEPQASTTAYGVSSQLRAVDTNSKDNCAFIKSITRGAGGTGDVSKYVESAMDAALTEAANNGADSYFVVNTDTTDSGASVVIEALRCN